MTVVAFVAGLVLLIVGAEGLVRGASRLAARLGISSLIIGLTVVAFGTSSPELAVSLKAAIGDQAGIAMGNVVGSNVFNLLGVLGLTGLLAPSGIALSPAMIGFDLPVMIAVALACLPICVTGGRISRWEGGVFFGYYLAYTLYLILAAARHDALPGFGMAMLTFVLPITALTLVLLALRDRRRTRTR
ncbi:sodium:calcium antiporter [Halomonas beimenensis]|uniref:Inner membrane protein YrbG, predicted calcium/sodium:proton antiporter n=1 Tax=Halomonas beimenensis TaxID=475662 RepID=A0A291P9Z4_9GAMM|nr:hypothetical protein [Halomonas beimenensis]ATJ83720.1 inner membrane protein YrbG, predicted calcium/sodium:proton antiporter [Halomonas beimenensis]